MNFNNILKKIGILSLLIHGILIGNNPTEIGTNSTDSDYLILDHLALKSNTDKSSSFHNYTAVYAKYLAPIRNQPLKFLEVGIWKGNSVKLWEAYFPNANLHFIDITPQYLEYTSTRSQYHFLDQANPQQLQGLVADIGGDFDVIIDDGGHQMQQQITSFQELFPYVKKGGMYIIEDLHTSYWKTFGGYGTTDKPRAGKGTAIDFLKDLVDGTNYISSHTTCADFDKAPSNIRASMTYLQEHIESIHFYSGICIIFKR